MNRSSLHEFIIRSFLQNQRPPAVSEIATRFESDATTARQGLRALEDYHTMVLCCTPKPTRRNGDAEDEACAIGDEVSVTVQNGRLLDTDFVVHFPVLMRNAWDNVIYTCSVQLLFRNEAEVDGWCATRGIPKGDVRPIKQIWGFAVEWYGRHADADWTKWSLRDAIDIFSRHKLAGPIWAIGDKAEPF
ncbi:Alkylmercury lyase [Metarhizium album ARSEF 1941]|uniref:Alkylmercury lyase n=1 Tax=Metarhizium album (strain ARSEF 1941) TaxID=1081103 RepID=A0A0B2X7Y3_METAS|nr:Alkylmercury lyase [Metarhizium album ARSEF 1941]KHO01401.1 Alkylmercury lyase [Metarhizium album ARSEF 1941]